MHRLSFLDNLKVALTWLVIFHHAAMPFLPGAHWAYHPSDPDEMMPGVGLFLSTNAAFFMGLFFMISGYLVPKSFDRQGGEVFVQRKLIRLGIPLVVMTILFSSITSEFEIGHMWFVESLLLFCIVYTVVRLVSQLPRLNVRPQFGLSLPGMAVQALVLGAVCYLVRCSCPQDKWVWVMGIFHIEPAHYVQYIVMFVFGIMASSNRWFETMHPRVGLVSLIIGVALATGNYLRGEGAWGDFVGQWFGFYESMLCVFLSVGLVWLFRLCCNHDTPFLRWCALLSYGVYVVHLPVLLALQHLLDGVPIGGGIGKLIYIGVAATIMSYLLTWVLRMIPGVKRVL